jgi:hypothetical protein
MMKAFDPDGWPYDHVALMRLISKLTTQTPQIPRPSAERMHDMAFLCGGKAFGLSMCDLIAPHARALTVPAWVPLSSLQQAYMATGLGSIDLPRAFRSGRLIVRSSDIEEDWLSEESGMNESRSCDVTDLRERIAQSSRRGQPVVVQERVEGIGIVVDIAWSALLGNAVVRVKTGRDARTPDGRPFYTSATADKEGVVGLFAADTNERLLPLHHGKLLGDKALALPLQRIARTLVRVISRVGIDFGVQLELIVHPEHPDRWHLVQVRPSPDAVRGYRRGPSPTTTIVTTTPVVSHAFNVTAEVVHLRHEDAAVAMAVASSVPGSRAGWSREGFLARLRSRERAAIERLVGKMVLWEYAPSDYYTLEVLSVLTQLGVVGHISNGILLINTTHGSINPSNPDRERTWNRVNATSAVLGINPEAFEILRKLSHHARATIRMISDGLVGQIFMVG